jgi:ribonuclease HI
MSPRIEISTDGGCIGNPGPGAWAFVIKAAGEERAGSGFEPATTNNRMELTAVREALRALEAMPNWRNLPVTLTTDSQYVQKGISEWILVWVRNGWKTSANKPVKNSDLWIEIWGLSRSRDIAWNWVMGHSGNPGNERCHHMVEEEVKRRA